MISYIYIHHLTKETVYFYTAINRLPKHKNDCLLINIYQNICDKVKSKPNMYKIKVPLDNLRMNNDKINKKNLNISLNNVNLGSYDYIDDVHVLYKTNSKNGRRFTTRSLELFCTKKITPKCLRKIIRKLKTNGLHEWNDKSHIKVTFVNVENSDICFGLDFKSLKPIEIPLYVRRKNQSTYSTMKMYSK